MLSSICVATITGLPAARQARVSRFWIGGTCCTGSSTPEVAARHHDAVRGLEDRGEGLDRRRLLDLRQDRRAPVGELARLEDVARPLHEGERQPVDAELAGELEVLLVLVRQRRQRQHHVGDVDALAVRDLAADDDLGQRVLRRAFGDLQPDLAVVDQERRARLERGEDLRMRQADAGDVAIGGVEVEAERRALGSSSTGPSAKVPQRSFGPCRSARMPIGRPTSVSTWRTSACRRAMSSCVPWLMLSRNTSAPATNRLRIISKESDDGPSVATILTLRCRRIKAMRAPPSRSVPRRL